ncbi:MAG: ATP-binding protein [Bacteroidales bacterium]|nr:ATP-binding protein [Bacteroidales bacterium]
MYYKYAKITVRNPKQTKEVRIGSDLKPDIVEPILEKWQSLLDSIADIVNVPSGLIMKLNEESIEVFLKSHSKGNPYHIGEEAPLDYGLYCETVIGTQSKLLVPDATKSAVWKNNNPDVELNMISYLGYPLNWPDGEVFGTVCLLDNKENHYNETYNQLLYQVKQHIETDLRLLISKNELEEKHKQLELLNQVKSQFLALISHDIRGSVSTIDELLKLIIADFESFDKVELINILKTLSQTANSTYLTLADLLSWSKKEALDLKADKTELNLVGLIEKILEYLKYNIQFKELKVTKEFYADEVIIIADKNMMETSLRNIISNAIKYTDSKGLISIKIKKNGEQTVIEIEDSGKGMAEDVLSKLYTYNQLSIDKSKGSSAGIGLIITKEFLDKNDASLSVSSVIGKGSKFIITI